MNLPQHLYFPAPETREMLLNCFAWSRNPMVNISERLGKFQFLRPSKITKDYLHTRKRIKLIYQIANAVRYIYLMPF